MKEIREIITVCGFLISGVLGVAIGNLEETLFYSTPKGDCFKHSYTYYLFALFIIIGFIFIAYGFKKSNE